MAATCSLPPLLCSAVFFFLCSALNDLKSKRNILHRSVHTKLRSDVKNHAKKNSKIQRLLAKLLLFTSRHENEHPIFEWKLSTGTPPLTRFFGPGKNRVKGKPRYRRSILVLKPQNGEFETSKSTFSLVFTSVKLQLHYEYLFHKVKRNLIFY